MKMKDLLFVLMAFVALSFSACQPAQGNEEPEYTYGQDATVESLDILILESFPVQVQVTVSGYLPDGCTELHEITVERQDQDFILTVRTRRPTGDIACTQALVPFEETVELDVEGLAAGTYTVTAHGLEDSFTL